MASMNINVPHQLPPEEALARIKQLLSKLRADQKDKVSNVFEEWSGNTGRFGFSMQGFDLAGTIEVQPGGIQINADLPFALTFFKGTISRVITDKAKEVLQ